jgi:hypothetical protein
MCYNDLVSMAIHTSKFLHFSVLLLNEIKGLCDSNYRCCIATDSFFSKRIGKSLPQICRYIQYLRDTQQVIVQTSKLQKDPVTNKLFRQRKITLGPKVDPKCFKFQHEIDLVRMQNLHGKQKHRLLKEISLKLPIPTFLTVGADGEPLLSSNPTVEELLNRNAWYELQTPERKAIFDADVEKDYNRRATRYWNGQVLEDFRLEHERRTTNKAKQKAKRLKIQGFLQARHIKKRKQENDKLIEFIAALQRNTG